MQLREYVVPPFPGEGGMVKKPAPSYAQLYLESLIH